MKRNFFYAIVITLCGTIGFSSCTKDYDDDLRIQRELIEQNTKDLRAMIDAYQVLVENTIEQMDIAYKNADDLIKQEMADEFNAAKTRLTDLETALAAAESNISNLQTDLTIFEAAVELDFLKVNNSIGIINSRIDDADEEITALDGRLKTAETALDDLKEWKTLAEKELADLEKSQPATTAELEAMKTRINTVEGEITSLETLCDNLKDEFQAADLALDARIDDLTNKLGVQETSLTALITSVQTTVTDEINDFKEEMRIAFDTYKTTVDDKLAAMTSDLEEVIADVSTLTSDLADLSGQVGTLKTAVDNLTAQIAGLASAADLEILKTNVEDDIAAIKNRIQSIQWVHAYADKNLTLNITVGTDEFTAAKLEAELYINSNDAKAVDKIVNGEIALEVLANQVLTRSIVTSPFQDPVIEKVNDNVVKITLNWADLSALYGSYSSALTGDPIEYQLAVKVTDASNNTVVTDFAGIVIKK